MDNQLSDRDVHNRVTLRVETSCEAVDSVDPTICMWFVVRCRAQTVYDQKRSFAWIWIWK